MSNSSVVMMRIPLRTDSTQFFTSNIDSTLIKALSKIGFKGRKITLKSLYWLRGYGRNEYFSYYAFRVEGISQAELETAIDRNYDKLGLRNPVELIPLRGGDTYYEYIIASDKLVEEIKINKNIIIGESKMNKKMFKQKLDEALNNTVKNSIINADNYLVEQEFTLSSDIVDKAKKIEVAASQAAPEKVTIQSVAEKVFEKDEDWLRAQLGTADYKLILNQKGPSGTSVAHSLAFTHGWNPTIDDYGINDADMKNILMITDKNGYSVAHVLASMYAEGKTSWETTDPEILGLKTKKEGISVQSILKTKEQEGDKIDIKIEEALKAIKNINEEFLKEKISCVNNNIIIG